MDYTVDYFIEKFEAISEDKWCTGDFVNLIGQCCALGHCGERDRSTPEEADKLREVFYNRHTKMVYGIAETNDGGNPHYQQPTPKQRILAALRDIKNLQQS